VSLAAQVVSGAARLPATIPVDPDAATARRWATDELAKPVYHQRPSLLSRIIEWIADQLSGVSAAGLPSPVVLLLVVVVIAAVVAVALVLNGPVRRSRRVASERGVLDADDVRTADQIRRAADAASGAGDWTLAVVERFRAIVRGLEERTVLDERAGRTAHEAADAAALRLPGLGTELVTAGRLFDQVAYGHESASAADDTRLRELDAQVRAARPVATVRIPDAAAGVPS
jgi:hypothetical protein